MKHQGVDILKSTAVPQKLPVNQFDHFYLGGYQIGELRHGPGGPMRPEEWIGSITTRFGEANLGLSQLTSGEMLRDCIMAEPENWLGREHLDFFGVSTEILVKLLDPDQRLPVHFHPNRKFSKEHLSLGHGKTEAWIILEAPVNATVGLGFKEEFTKEEIARLVNTLDSSALLASLHKVNVRKGDAILVPSGVPHAIDPGIFLLELQEPTDLSVLLEWNDFAVDGVKDGHLGLGFDCVLDALRYTPISIEEMKTLISHNNLSGTTDTHIFSEISNPYFRADFLTGNPSKIDSGFAVLLVLDGTGKVEFLNQSSIKVSKGDALVIPSSAGSWGISEATGLLCRPPLPEFANLAV